MRAGPVGSHPDTPPATHERLWWAVAVLLVILLLLLTGGRAAGQAPLTPAERAAINQAIDKGWAPGDPAPAGIALAESGAPTSDPARSGPPSASAVS